MLVMFLIFSVV